MQQTLEAIFEVAGLALEIRSDYPFQLEDGFRPFLSDRVPDYVIVLHGVSEIIANDAPVLYERVSFQAVANSAGKDRRFFRRNYDHPPFAEAEYDWSCRRIDVKYLFGAEKSITSISSCFFYIAWEALLYHERRIMFHSACIKTPYGGILFSGPSGIGKSTQAALWCDSGSGELINGDRSILYHKDNTWIASGSPYAGSSRCYRNEHCQIRAIVMLRQAPVCTIRRLSVAEGFRNIFSGLTVNSWDADFVSFACDVAEQLAGEIPVYELACTPDENAVKLLQSTLEKV